LTPGFLKPEQGVRDLRRHPGGLRREAEYAENGEFDDMA
jgi:hypothetical protein